MKKLISSITLFTAMFLMIACGGSDSKNNDNKNQNQSSGVCTYGTYECHGEDSYFCGYPDSSNEVMWIFAEKCNDGCNEQTGKCVGNSNSENGDYEDPSDSDSEDNGDGNNYNEQCEAGDRMCRSIDPEHSFICNEYSHTPIVFEKCNESCDSNSGKCKPWTDSDSKLTWSAKAPKTMLWDDAVLYCQNLDEGDHDDWRMPNIDELRTLVRNCSGVMTGSACKISEENNCLSYVSCFEESCACTETSQENDHYLKIDDIGILWSSSEVPEFETVWGLQVNPSIISSCSKAVEYSVRCVRN